MLGYTEDNLPILFDNMSGKNPLFCFAFGALSVSQVLNDSKNRRMFIGYCLLLTLLFFFKTSQK